MEDYFLEEGRGKLQMKKEEAKTKDFLRKTATVALGAAMLLTSALPTFAAGDKVSFTDVPDNHFAKAAIEFCNPNIMQGKGNGKFDPDGKLTRAEAVQILYKVDGGFLKEAPAVFSDVKAGEWYSDALNYAVANKYCSGYPTGEFKPDGTLTYQEFAAMVANRTKASYPAWAQKTDLFEGTPKCTKYSSWAKDGILLAEFMKITENPEKLDATKPITRAQAAVFANKAATTQFKVLDPIK